MQDKTRETLSLFVEKANKLLSLSFIKSITERGGLDLNISWNANEGLNVIRGGPGDEAVDAFVLTFRFFIQNNERVSFGSLNDQVMADSGVSDAWKTEFTRIRAELNEYLDARPTINYAVDGKSISSNRELLDTFVYGGLAHANVQKRQVFEAWRSDQMAFQLLQFQFATILVNTLKAISYMAHLSEQELKL